MIADKTNPPRAGKRDRAVSSRGVPIWIDRGVRLAHGKAMVIDRKVVLTGSMNWTALENSEDLNLIASEAVAAAYMAHWQNRQAVSVPFTRREDWCRKPEVVDVKSEASPK